MRVGTVGRLACTVVAVGVTLTGCGGDEPAPEAQTTTTTAPERTRADIGAAIAEGMSMGEPKLAFVGADPEGLAEVAAAYCAELETNGRAAAQEVLERRLQAYLRGVLPPLASETDGGTMRAAGLAITMRSRVEQGALAEVCPELSEDRFLPEN